MVVQAEWISLATASRSTKEEENEFVRSIIGIERKAGVLEVGARREERYSSAFKAAVFESSSWTGRGAVVAIIST